MEQVVCSTCNARVDGGSKFCNSCGVLMPSITLATERMGSYHMPVQHAPQAGGLAPSTGRTVSLQPQQPAYAEPQPIYAEPQPIYQPQPAQPSYQAAPYYQGPVQQVNVVVSPQAGPTVVMVNKKSVGVALLLTFLFGPLGMFYSTVGGAIIMTIVSVLLAAFTLGFSVLITWPICMIWAAIAANE